MLTRVNKFWILCISLILAVFLYACESARNEDYHQADSDIPVEDITNEHEEPQQTELPQEEQPREEPSQSDPYWEIEDTLQFLLDTANERRLGIEKVSEEFVREIAYYRDFVLYDLSPLWSAEQRDPASSVTSEEALEDVEVFFDVLRYVYGGYELFGGDEVFEPVKEQIAEDILQVSGDITRDTLFEILLRNLSPIINDRHFVLGRITQLGSQYFFLVSSGVYFDKTDLGFRNRENGLYVEEAVGYDIANIMRIQLDELGQLFYAPVVMVESLLAGVQSITIVYENGVEEQLTLNPSSTRTSGNQLTSLLETNNIPIIVAPRRLQGSEMESSRRFLEQVRQHKDEPVVILDLQGNAGGLEYLPYYWMYLLTGEAVRENSVLFDKWDYGFEYPWTISDDSQEPGDMYLSEEANEIMEIFLNPTTVNGFRVENLVERHVVERKQVLIVLVDRQTRSAGEIFTDLAFNVQNTLIIGQNTDGGLTVSGGYRYQLPNSGMAFSFGRKAKIHPEGHFAEGVGFAPDVWVTGDVLAATLAMLQNG